MSERPDNPFQGASHVDLTLCGTSSDQMSSCDLQGMKILGLNLIKCSTTQGILNPVEKKSFLEDCLSPQNYANLDQRFGKVMEFSVENPFFSGVFLLFFLKKKTQKKTSPFNYTKKNR